MADSSVSAELTTELTKGSPFAETSDEITVKRELHSLHSQSLTISFQRTIRVADNAKANALPPGFGRLPIYRTQDYEQTLPKQMSGKDGFFIPMHQREAMWIKFNASEPFAIKVYVGGVNAVSGEPARETEKTLINRISRINLGQSIQDYVVAPKQLWLDGIASAEGEVRQFVAMPLGKGYTVEAQITGEESVGGLQFEIVPGKMSRATDFYDMSVKTLTGKTIHVRMASTLTVEILKQKIHAREGIPVDQQRLVCCGKQLEDARTIDDYNIPPSATIHLITRLRGGGGPLNYNPTAPGDMGIAADGRIRQTIVKDTIDPSVWDRSCGTIFNVQILNSASFESVTGQNPPATPITAAAYAQHGYPYFTIYNEQLSGIKGHFEGVKSVNKMDREGETTKDKAQAVAEVTMSTNNPVVLLDHKGNKVGFRTVTDMEKEVRDHPDKLKI